VANSENDETTRNTIGDF